MVTVDPMERIIAEALDAVGISYITDAQGNPSALDFRMENGIEIEVKRYHSDRIAAQMKRANNVIAVQGEAAVRWFAQMIRPTTPETDMWYALKVCNGTFIAVSQPETRHSLAQLIARDAGAEYVGSWNGEAWTDIEPV